jgi:multiple sugar transport system substrate-binding protein
MTYKGLTRRAVIELGAASLALAGLGSIAQAQANAIVVSWFGGTARADLFNSLVDMFVAEKGVAVGREFAPYADYFLRLNTQAAAGQMPDIVNITYQEMRGYAERQRILALDELTASGAIDVSKFPRSVLDAGRMNNAQYGISIGHSGPAAFINEGLFADAGVALPTGDWSWAQFEETMIALAGKLPEGTYASTDQTKQRQVFEVYLRSLGATIFDGEGRVGFTKEQGAEYLNMWRRLREAGAVPDAALASQDFSAPTNQQLFAVAKTAVFMINANQLHIWQKFQGTARKDTLGITFVPDGKKPGVSAIVSALFGISANTKNQALAAEFVNWWINNEKMALKYLNEHGALGNVDLQAKVEPLLIEPMKKTSAFLSEMVPVGKPFTAWPANGVDILTLWESKADNVSFGMSTADQAADEFFAEAASIAQFAKP